LRQIFITATLNPTSTLA